MATNNRIYLKSELNHLVGLFSTCLVGVTDMDKKWSMHNRWEGKWYKRLEDACADVVMNGCNK